MALAPKKTQLAALLVTFRTKLLALFNATVARTGLADNTAKLNNQTLAQIKAPVTQSVNSHIAANNPHGVTLEGLNSFTREEILKRLSSKVTEGSIPISGIINTTQMTLHSSTTLRAYAGTVIVVGGYGVILSGSVYYPIEIPMVANSTYYLYAKLENGVPVLEVSATLIADTMEIFLICSFVHNSAAAYGIGATVGVKINRISTYRVSPVTSGGAFIGTKMYNAAGPVNMWS